MKVSDWASYPFPFPFLFLFPFPFLTPLCLCPLNVATFFINCLSTQPLQWPRTRPYSPSLLMYLCSIALPCSFVHVSLQVANPCMLCSKTQGQEGSSTTSQQNRGRREHLLQQQQYQRCCIVWICLLYVQNGNFVYVQSACVHMHCLLLLQGLVPDDRIFSALLTMHKYPTDYGWYMQVSQGLPVLPSCMCHSHMLALIQFECSYIHTYSTYVSV